MWTKYAQTCLCFATIGLLYCADKVAVNAQSSIHTVPVDNTTHLIISDLLGTWLDKQGVFLPPRFSPFEVISNKITFSPDGKFVQVVNKATGLRREKGNYTLHNNRLNLNFRDGVMSYDISRSNSDLVLRTVNSGKQSIVLRLVVTQTKNLYHKPNP